MPRRDGGGLSSVSTEREVTGFHIFTDPVSTLMYFNEQLKGPSPTCGDLAMSKSTVQAQLLKAYVEHVMQQSVDRPTKMRCVGVIRN